MTAEVTQRTDLGPSPAVPTARHARVERYRRPLCLIYHEAYRSAQDAKSREQFLKSGSGKRYFQKQLRKYFAGVL